MLILIFILSVTFGVLSVATDDDLCDQRRPAHCFTPDVEVKFPDNVEVLNKICPILIPRFKCLVDFKNKCGDKVQPIYFEKIDILNDLVVEACDKESKFHQELSTRLPCVEEVLMSHRNTCDPMVQEAVEEITSGVSLDVDEDGYFNREEDRVKYFCFAEAIDISCFVASTSVKCGDKTGDLVGKVMNRVGFLDVSCPENIREEVKEAVAIIQLEMQLKLATEDIISKV